VEPDLAGPLSLRDTRGRSGRFERGDGGSWQAAIGRRLERYEREAVPFAVLLIEADGIERLLAAETGRDVAIAIEAVERAISDELRPADTLARESLGRYWLLAPDTNEPGARALAERVAGAVRQRASHRGAPLSVSIGVVVCPDDGADVDRLAERAEERLFGAQASGQQAVSSPD
jgi:diguanylate cyclase (GGDEF)-like protein